MVFDRTVSAKAAGYVGLPAPTVRRQSDDSPTSGKRIRQIVDSRGLDDAEPGSHHKNRVDARLVDRRRPLSGARTPSAVTPANTLVYRRPYSGRMRQG